MAEASLKNTDQSPSSTSTNPMNPPEDREPPSYMGSLFCGGGVAADEAKSVKKSTHSTTRRSSSNKSENKSSLTSSRSTSRKPLQSTDVLNKGVSQHMSQELMSVPPSNNPGGCFPDTIASFLGGGKGSRCNCGTCGTCGSCWDSESSRIPSSLWVPKPGTASTSIPVIEDLGVTPKSKDRVSKYSVSGAMNPPGSSIPTPAPDRRKKYVPSVSDIPETITTSMPSQTSLSEGIESTKTESSKEEDAFLPDDSAETKEKAKLYTEAELNQRIQEALEEREKELASKVASTKSEDSDLHFQQQLQEQLEQQGMMWNKDMRERLDANRSHYKKKQSILKTRIGELEEKCKTLQKSQEDDRLENEKQTEELESVRKEMTKIQEANEVERTKLLEQIAKKSQELSKLDEEKVATEKQSQHTIKNLQKQVRTLQKDKAECDKRARTLEKQVINMEGSLSNHTAALAGCKDARQVDQRKIVVLETQLERLTKDQATLLEEGQGATIELTAGDQDATTIAKSWSQNPSHEKVMEKVKGVLHNCIQVLSAPDAKSIAATPSDEKDSLDLSLYALESATNEHVRRLSQTEATAKNATDARVAAEVEVARLTDIIDNKSSRSEDFFEDAVATEKEIESQSQTKDPSYLAVKGYWERKATDTPQGRETPKQEFSDRETLQSEALDLLKRDIESLQRQCKMDESPAKDLLEDYASELASKVEHIRTELQALQHQLLKRPTLEMPPALPKPSVVKQLEHAKKLGAPADLLKQLADLQSKLVAAKVELRGKEEALANLEEENADTVRALGASQEQVEKLEKQVKELAAGKGIEENTDKGEGCLNGEGGLTGEGAQLEELLVMLEMKQTNEKLSDSIREQEAETASLKQAKEDLSQQVSSLTEQCNTLSKMLDEEKESSTKNKKEMEDQLASHKEECDVLSKALDEQKAEATALRAEAESSTNNKEMEDQLTSLKEECAVLTKALDEQKAEAASLNKNNQDIGDQLSDLKQKSEDITKELDEKNTKISEMARDATKSTLDRSFLTKRLDSIIRFIESEDEGKEMVPPVEATPHGDLDSLQKLDRIEQRISNEREQLAGLKDSIAELKSESEGTTLQLNNKISELERELNEKQVVIEASTSQLAIVKGELSTALEGPANNPQTLQSLAASSEQLKELKTKNESLSQQISALETQLESVTRERELEDESHAELESARAECAAAKSTVLKHSTRILELESLLETGSAECERLDKLLKLRPNVEEELLQKSRELEETSSTTIARCEAQVRQVREEHAREIDELLGQLDLVEAEHRDNCSEKEKTLKEKEAIIAALGSQLAGSLENIGALEDASRKHAQEIEQARDDVLQAKKDAEALKAELEKLQATHEDFLKKREEAIEAAREETIQEATVQFENFNALYRTMTANYKSASAKVQELEKEAQAAKHASEELSKEHTLTVASINSDLADLKATKAQEAAATARALKELQEAERGLQARLSQEQDNNRSVQKLLATVVSEKEELIAEMEDLRNVCEEAMSIAETTHSDPQHP